MPTHDCRCILLEDTGSCVNMALERSPVPKKTCLGGGCLPPGSCGVESGLPVNKIS